jgi:hypothetical protein
VLSRQTLRVAGTQPQQNRKIRALMHEDMGYRVGTVSLLVEAALVVLGVSTLLALRAVRRRRTRAGR